MKRVVVAALVAGIGWVGASLPAAAQGRPDSLSMSCDQARALLRSRGALVIGTGPHIYDRYVTDRRFCAVTEGTRPAWIATRDTRQCMVGYTCVPIEDLWPLND